MEKLSAEEYGELLVVIEHAKLTTEKYELEKKLKPLQNKLMDMGTEKVGKYLTLYNDNYKELNEI